MDVQVLAVSKSNEGTFAPSGISQEMKIIDVILNGVKLLLLHSDEEKN